MKIVFLDAGTFYHSPNIAEMLSGFGEIKLYEHTSPHETLDRITDAEIVLSNKVLLDEKILKNCPQLKLVCVTATGMNNIDLEAAKKQGIQVKNAAGYSTHSVAQTTLAMALHLVMQLESYHSFVRTSYSSHPYFTHLNPGFGEINGKIWGIIGMGTIGKQVAKIVEAFGGNIVYHSPSGKNLDTGFSHFSLAEMLPKCDFISIHSPLNEFTKNLIGSKELAFCKKNALLINVARGGIVDELALANAIDNEIISGAAVDVFANEPIRESNPLLHIRQKHKLLLTPHIAWGSLKARETLMKITCRNIQEYMESKK